MIVSLSQEARGAGLEPAKQGILAIGGGSHSGPGPHRVPYPNGTALSVSAGARIGNTLSPPREPQIRWIPGRKCPSDDGRAVDFGPHRTLPEYDLHVRRPPIRVRRAARKRRCSRRGGRGDVRSASQKWLGLRSTSTAFLAEILRVGPFPENTWGSRGAVLSKLSPYAAGMGRGP